jgi:hypothetical protein
MIFSDQFFMLSTVGSCRLMLLDNTVGLYNFMSLDPMHFTASKCVDICWFTITISAPRSDVFANYFTDTMAKVLWVFLYITYLLNLFQAFLSCCIKLVTWITTGPSCRHLLYAYKLTTCSFVCMGIGEAGPSSLL